MNHFVNAVEAHLKSITERNLAAFSEFLHPAHDCIIILPNGNIVEGHENVLNFHKEWFKDLDWHMDIKTKDLFDTGNIGYALLDVVYHDLDEDKNPCEIKYFLSLLFMKVDGNWILIRDQNTLK